MGKNSIAAALGFGNKAKAAKGNWIVVSEWEYDDSDYILIGVRTEKVDGKKVKADTWYKLVNGELVEA